jgi:hypothetical protein
LKLGRDFTGGKGEEKERKIQPRRQIRVSQSNRKTGRLIENYSPGVRGRGDRKG